MTKKNPEKKNEKITREVAAVIAVVIVLIAMFAALAIVPSVLGFGAVPAACGVCLAICLGLFLFIYRP